MPHALSAQAETPVYWRYDAPGRIDLVEVEDVDRDGIDDIMLVADGINLVLVGPDGIPKWSTPYQAQDLIQFLLLVSIDNNPYGPFGILLGTEKHLILLDNDGNERWKRTLKDSLAQIARIKSTEGDEILVALKNGEFLRYSGSGELLWQIEFDDSPTTDASPQLVVADFNRDRREEIILAYFTDAGFSKLVMLDDLGDQLWERSSNGQIHSLAMVEFDSEDPLDIAVATSLDQVFLYSIEGDRRWPYRSPNKQITELVSAQLDNGPALLVGTSVGTIIAYDRLGRRYWTGQYHEATNRPIVGLSAAPQLSASDNPVALAILLGQGTESDEPADVILLDSDGRRLEPSFLAADTAGQSQLVDINRDGRSELLLAGFATLELLDPGIGARHYSEAWDYRVGAEPQAVLIDDIDMDGLQELLIGTNDGKLHALENDGTPMWVEELGGVISHLAVAENEGRLLPDIVVIHNNIEIGEDGLENVEGWIEVLKPDGRLVWNVSHDTTVSSILIEDINRSGRPELLVGTKDGQLLAYSLAGEEIWRSTVNAVVNKIILIEGMRAPELLIISGSDTIERLNNKGVDNVRIAEYLDEISDLQQITLEPKLVPILLVAVEDGTVRALTERGSQIWELGLDGLPTTTYPAGESLLVATDEQKLYNVDSEGFIVWELNNLGRISEVYWGDLNDDIRPDVAIGNRAGEIRLYGGDGNVMWEQLSLASEVSYISAVSQQTEAEAKLVAVTDNGVVQLFASQADRPPLLIKPRTEVDPGEYNITVSVIDVENDAVTVQLELYDTASDQWLAMGERNAANGNDTLFWPVKPSNDGTEVRYRFNYSDGFHSGQVEPPPGPAAAQPASVLRNTLMVTVFAIIATVGAGYYVIQSRSPSARIRRFFAKIRQHPESTLTNLDAAYAETRGSPDFLLGLANRARQENAGALASLADGLFLLDARPESAPAIINLALNEAKALEPSWNDLDYWQTVFRTVHSLITAPTVTELSLLRPQLQHLLDSTSGDQINLHGFRGLLPVITILRDSERVDLAEDRVIYLNEVLGLLIQLQHQLSIWPPQIERSLVSAIVNRWLGLVKAELEEIHGKAQLQVNLITKHLVPVESTIISLEISNVGRAPAENINLQLEPDPAYASSSKGQIIPLLPPGRSRRVQVSLSPLVEDRFRVLFSISYSDRLASNKKIAFADMVHLLPPIQEYQSLVNPYAPGMPLRQNSTVFFGREDLFDFVVHNSTSPIQPTVQILVGQRRTGKTSALLQLEHHLPEYLTPIYIDCQSLGVIPGMPALFFDMAWTIADKLSNKGHDVKVPELEEWQQSPAGRFEHEFIPQVLKNLPEGDRLLLIFDEFEAFEDLVNDGILPHTLFTFLRHLMQHSDGLSFIFAGTRRLEDMGSDYWSILFNIALYRQVGFLSRTAATNLILNPVAPGLVYDDLAIDKILKVTAGHPYFLQLVCYALVNRANARQSGYVTISDVNAALDDMMRLGEVHFSYIWKRSTDTERALLIATSRAIDFEEPFRPSDLVQFLVEYDIYINPTEVTVGLDRLVDREIFREIRAEGSVLYEVKLGLIGLWVAKSKSLSRLYKPSGKAPVRYR